MDGMLLSIIIFLVVYVAITFELANKAVATLSGVAVLTLLHVIDEHHAIEFIASGFNKKIINIVSTSIDKVNIWERF